MSDFTGEYSFHFHAVHVIDARENICALLFVMYYKKRIGLKLRVNFILPTSVYNAYFYT